MKKIIVYGINMNHYKMRRYIERFLDDEYEILGYSDGYYTSDFLDHKPFFRPEEIYEQQADFILMNCELNSSYKEIRRNLAALGISPGKIVRPTIFTENNPVSQVDLIKMIQNQYNQEKGLIFGMSYSAEGIIEQNLAAPFYNCSWSGLDLYYNFRIYDYMQAHGIFTGGNTALWVFPYYYFDYDLSRTTNTVPISALWRLDDWHHYGESFDAKEHITNARMFAKKMADFFHMPKYSPRSTNVYGGADGTQLLEPLWFSNHNVTVLENKKIFVEFFNKLADKGGNVTIVIPPFYLNGLNEVSKAAVQSKREKFYQILQELEKETGKIPVFDYMDRFAGKRADFYDLTHLNITGAKEFTDILNDEVIRDLP